jgi:hypothetical protein
VHAKETRSGGTSPKLERVYEILVWTNAKVKRLRTVTLRKAVASRSVPTWGTVE